MAHSCAFCPQLVSSPSSAQPPPAIASLLTINVSCSILAPQSRPQPTKEQHFESSNTRSLSSLFNNIDSLTHGKRIHAYVATIGLDQDPYFANLLIVMYRNFGTLEDARSVFDNLQYPAVVAWNSLISFYSKNGRARDGLQLFQQMLQRGHKPSRVTFLIVIGACSSPEFLAEGKWIHGCVVKDGFKSDIAVCNALITMYSRCGSLKEAKSVFYDMKHRNLVSWNTMIAGYSKQGLEKEAVRLFGLMQKQGMKPDEFTFVTMLQLYGSSDSLAKGKEIHESILDCGFHTDLVVGNALINMYGKCGALNEAVSVFDQMLQRDVVSWTAMIDAYSQQGQGRKALQLFQQMQHNGTKPNKVTFMGVLKVCAALADLNEGQAIHATIMGRGFERDVLVGNTLLYMYGKCGAVMDARAVFDNMHEHSRVSWTVMIHAYSAHRYGKEALHLFEELQQQGEVPDKAIFVSILHACATLAALSAGKAVHAAISNRGLKVDVILGNALVSMYSKCGALDEARSVFDKMRQHDVISWNAMITAYAKEGNSIEAFHLYHQMQERGVEPDKVTFICLLGACTCSAAIAEGRVFHVRILEHGFDGEVVVGNALLNMYSKCGTPEDAHAVFDKLQVRNVVSWNAAIALYSHYGNCKGALKAFREMKEQGVEPDKVTFISILGACLSSAEPTICKTVHSCIMDCGFASDITIASALIRAYGKCNALKAARDVFDTIHMHNVVSWTAMMDAYSQCGCYKEAVQHFSLMQQNGVQPNKITFVSLLSSFDVPAALDEGKAIHKFIIEREFESDVFIGNALISMYGKCRALEDACRVFSNMVQRDVVSWTAMIHAFSKCEQHQEALQLYARMQQEGVEPNKVTFLSVLHACSSLQALVEGKAIHASIVNARLGSDMLIKQALLNMYEKCCTLEGAGTLQEAGMGSPKMISAL